MPLRPEEHTGASLILISHDHLDHLDEKTLPGAAQASPDATVLLPSVGVQHAIASGVNPAQLYPMCGDDVFERDGVRITAIPAAHQRLDHDEEHSYHYLGYMIQGNGVTLYHTGDIQNWQTCFHAATLKRNTAAPPSRPAYSRFMLFQTTPETTTCLPPLWRRVVRS
ncbi:MAG: MBL fold metallo-hydrolase [Abditibacteriales bacterium]|nr:MBL fold metallo-hydrolase [Abditibacteriales bacterium]